MAKKRTSEPRLNTEGTPSERGERRTRATCSAGGRCGGVGCRETLGAPVPGELGDEMTIPLRWLANLLVDAEDTSALVSTLPCDGDAPSAAPLSARPSRIAVVGVVHQYAIPATTRGYHPNKGQKCYIARPP